MKRHRRSYAASILAVVAVALSAPGCADREPAVRGGFEKEWLNEVEDLSESLANDLLALSVAARERNDDAISEFVAERVTTRIPTSAERVEPVVKWIGKHDWSYQASDGPEELSRDEFVGRIGTVLAHFDELEDVRFKVKGADFDPRDPDQGQARVKFFVIGRDHDGRREWLEGLADVEVERSAATAEPDRADSAGDAEAPARKWLLRRFEVESMISKVSERDLFDEVALPAGVSAIFPPFGVGANSGFVSHGAAAGDVNGDGLLDIAATGVDRNYLYLNRGDGSFRDVSTDSLVAYAPPGSGALFVDYDNDGDLDLFLAAVGRQVLLRNQWIPDGQVRFDDVSEEAGVAIPAVGFSAAAADVNGDGFTDLYVASYNRYGTVMPDSWGRATNGTPNLLFLNRGDGTFEEAAESMGVDDSRWSYAATFVDLDEDGDLDLYVANDFGENAFYRNDHDSGGGFTDRADEAGIVDPGFGMGVSFGDYDNDGDLDLHVTNMSSTAGNRILKRLYPEDELGDSALAKLAVGNSLYENNGDGTFRDVTSAAGGIPAGWAFGGGFVDFDNDGWEDLYSPNGFISGKSMNDT
jgi:hypothetical protein